MTGTEATAMEAVGYTPAQIKEVATMQEYILEWLYKGSKNIPYSATARQAANIFSGSWESAAEAAEKK